MTTLSNVLGKTCVACGQERKKKDMLGYDPKTFEPYCISNHFCNEHHPNAPIPMLERGNILNLLPYDEAKEKYIKWIEEHHANPEKEKKIRRMVEHPSTLRIGDPELAEFVLDLQAEMNFTSVAEAIRFCIQRMKEEHGGFHQAVEVKKQEIKEEENLQEFVASPVKKVTVPKSESLSNDDWNF